MNERLQALAALMELESAFLEQCVQHGALNLEEPSDASDDLTPFQLARLRRLERICRGLDVDVFAGCIIIDLLDRLDAQQQELERLRLAADSPPSTL